MLCFLTPKQHASYSKVFVTFHMSRWLDGGPQPVKAAHASVTLPAALTPTCLQAAGANSIEAADALCVVARLAAMHPGADTNCTDEAFQRAVDIKLQLLGPVHPDVPQLLHDTGCMLLDAGRCAWQLIRLLVV